MDYDTGLKMVQWAKTLLIVRLVLIVLLGLVIVGLLMIPLGLMGDDGGMLSFMCLNIGIVGISLIMPVVLTAVVLHFLNKKVFEPFQQGNLTSSTKNSTLIMGVLCFFTGGWLGIIAAILLLVTFASWDDIVGDLYGTPPYDPYGYARGFGGTAERERIEPIVRGAPVRRRKKRPKDR